MRKILTASVGLLTLTACYSEDDFTDDYIQVSCDKLFECADEASLEALGYESSDDCVTATEDYSGDGESDDSCAFVSGEAQTCIDELSALSCEDYLAFSWPDACNNAYDCG